MTNLKMEATAFFKLIEGDEPGKLEKLRRVLGRLDGVLEVKVNFVMDTISIRYDSERVSREQIKKKVDLSNRVSQ